jgi:aspartate racemase
MEGPIYSARLAAKGIAHRIPDAAARERIDRIIFDELVYGRFQEPSRAAFRAVIDGFARSGCDGVVLGCTEIPLLVGPADAALPLLDSTRILARAALREATRA